MDQSNNSKRAEGIQKFNSRSHLLELVAKTRIRVDTDSQGYKYPLGLRFSVNQFIDEIKSVPMNLHHFSVENGEWDVRFTMYRQSGEVYFWRALETLRKYSKTLCHGCGDVNYHNDIHDSSELFCTDCRGTNGNTGTWLDKY